MVSQVPRRAHNPDHAGPSSTGPAYWPVNSAHRFDRGGIRRARLPKGQRHVSALRVVHEALAERGVADTVRLFDERQLTRATAASRYFELDDLAEMLSRIEDAAGSGQDAASFDNEYRRRFADGNAVRDAVARKMAQSPSDFQE
jgi:hypothetical protein